MRFPFVIALLLSCPTLRARAQEAVSDENPLALAQNKDVLRGFALSPDGKSAAVWGTDWSLPSKGIGKLQVWDVATRTMTASLVGHAGEVQRAVWSGDGTQIVSQSADGVTALWDVASGRLKQAVGPAVAALQEVTG